MPRSDLDNHPLTIALKILQGFGEAGQHVWTVSKFYADPKKEKSHPPEGRLPYLTAAIAFLRSKALEKEKEVSGDKVKVWRTLPVDFQTFVEAPGLLNKVGALWPGVMKYMAEMNNGKYTEAVLTGSIGVAKTTGAIYTQAYQLYTLSCLEDPHKLFDLDSSSEILIIFQSISKSLAQDVDYKRFRDMIENSPYFRKNFMFDTERLNQLLFPRNIAVKPVAGHDTAAIGQNVIGGILDEANFQAVVEKSKQTRDGGTYDQAESNYNSISMRRKSRFMQMGVLPGMLCLVSSRNYPGQLTDRVEEKARQQIQDEGKTNIYIYDKRLWEIRPERFSGDTFRVFAGDDTRKPRILEENEIVASNDERLVDLIPVEFRSDFVNNLLKALRDIAGRSTLALHPFILDTDAVTSCFGKVQSIASRPDCDFAKTRIEIYPKRFMRIEEPRFAHIDLAISKDSAGVSIGHISHFKEVDRGDYKETLPVIVFDMILEVQPPHGGEIQLENIRKLLYTLRDKLGLPIKWVTFDSFQSKDSMQILSQQGFKVGYQSMDIDTYAYDLLKQAFNDGRILAPEHPKVVKELISLEFEPKKNKIDHPPMGSKDTSDSVAGVAFGLTMRRELWVRHKIPINKRPKLVTDEKGQNKNSLTQKEKAEING